MHKATLRKYVKFLAEKFRKHQQAMVEFARPETQDDVEFTRNYINSIFTEGCLFILKVILRDGKFEGDMEGLSILSNYDEIHKHITNETEPFLVELKRVASTPKLSEKNPFID